MTSENQDSKAFTDLKDFLEKQRIPFREIRHSRAATAEEYHFAVGSKYSEQVKCILLKIKETNTARFLVCAIQAQKKIPLQELKNTLKVKKISLASLDDLRDLTGCNFGELHPFSSLFGLPLLLDSDFSGEDKLYINAGKVDVSFIISFANLKRVQVPVLF